VFDRVTLHVSDLDASRRFYGELLGTLGIGWDDFELVQSGAVTRRLHLGFRAASRAKVDEFWSAGLASGYQDDGAPGERPQYAPDYYGAFLLDPDGNSAEAVHYTGVRTEGTVDHVWFRVADVAASKRFYESIAPDVGFRLGTDTDERVSFRVDQASGTFSAVAGEPTENMHLAFRAPRSASLVDPDGNTIELVSRP
jgi:catechol 2,3-dioxygenase-like lactoylglutathione lyase family enzyme